MQIYRYRWNRCGRKDRRCIVTARGTMNSCRVEFEDGYVMVTSRNALAKAGSWPPWKSPVVVFQAPADAIYVCAEGCFWYYIHGKQILAARWPTNDTHIPEKERKRLKAKAEAAHAATQ